jgi:uncharacterized membrane protein
MANGRTPRDRERNVSTVEAALHQRQGIPPQFVMLLILGVALVLGLVLPKIDWGPQVDGTAAQPFLFSVAGALLLFVALVISLLFVMIQYATAIFTPRLTIFRDDAKVRRAFVVLVASVLFCTVAGLRVGDDKDVSAIATGCATVLLFVALLLARNVNSRAIHLLQMSNMLEELRSRGAQVLTRLYTRPARADGEPDPLPEITQTVRWPDAGALLVQVHIAKLGALAAEFDGVIRLHVGVGEELQRGGVVITVHGGTRPITDRTLLETLQVGVDRQFGQDPLLAFRLLTEIGIRALSPAVNDPFSAVSATAALDDLLRIVADKDLDIGRDADPSGVLRVVLKMPTWDDFLTAGVDEIAPDAAGPPVAANRLASLLDELPDVVPPERRDAVERRRRRFAQSRSDSVSIVEHAADRQERVTHPC